MTTSAPFTRGVLAMFEHGGPSGRGGKAPMDDPAIPSAAQQRERLQAREHDRLATERRRVAAALSQATGSTCNLPGTLSASLANELRAQGYQVQTQRAGRNETETVVCWEAAGRYNLQEH